MSGARHRILAKATALLCLGASAAAHDFWIEPSASRPAVGDVVGITLLIGHDGHADPYTRNPAHLRTFWRVDALGAAADIPGDVGATPAGMMRIESPGVHIVGYTSQENRIELEPAKFESYLGGEGLERISEIRAARGESDQPGRERYSRSAKSLVLAGADAPTAGFDRVIGLPLEFVPMNDPFAIGAGGTLALRVLLHGEALEGLRVDAQRQGAGATAAISARTDSRGMVELTIDEPGAWLFTATHMWAAEPGEDVEWRSVWGSLTAPVGAAPSSDRRP